MFRFNHHHQGAYYLSLLKLKLQPHHRTNHNDVFKLIILKTITLASSNNTLPNDGD
jgi:hypothetical protein